MSTLEIIGICSIAYVALCVIIYFTQELFLFHPEKLISNFEYKFDADFEEILEKAKAKTQEAVDFAENSPLPDESELFTDVYA